MGKGRGRGGETTRENEAVEERSLSLCSSFSDWIALMGTAREIPKPARRTGEWVFEMEAVVLKRGRRVETAIELDIRSGGVIIITSKASVMTALKATLSSF